MLLTNHSFPLARLSLTYPPHSSISGLESQVLLAGVHPDGLLLGGQEVRLCRRLYRPTTVPRPLQEIIDCTTWWRHQMKTFSASLVLCAGNSPITGEFPSQRLVTRSFDVFFDLRLNKRLSKQSWGWWFETSSRSSWRHCNGDVEVFWDRNKPKWNVYMWIFVSSCLSTNDRWIPLIKDLVRRSFDRLRQKYQQALRQCKQR